MKYHSKMLASFHLSKSWIYSLFLLFRISKKEQGILNDEGGTRSIGKLRYSVFLFQDSLFCFLSKSRMEMLIELNLGYWLRQLRDLEINTVRKLRLAIFYFIKVKFLA